MVAKTSTAAYERSVLDVAGDRVGVSSSVVKPELSIVVQR